MMIAGWIVALALTGLAAHVHRRARRRAELVARACHELRGPLTAAGLALYSAGRRSEAPPRRIAAVDLQLRRAELALTDLSLAPSGGRARDRVEAVSVLTLLEAEAASWREVVWAHGCELVLAEPVPNVLVRADARRLSQATGNLIANALEHGAGTVRLGARLEARRVRIEVSDDGPGLPAPIPSLSRPRGARGRGLAIVAEVARRSGGALHSAPSARGARLVIQLPAAS
jgi:signal transduction histidine kinase